MTVRIRSQLTKPKGRMAPTISMVGFGWRMRAAAIAITAAATNIPGARARTAADMCGEAAWSVCAAW